MSIKQNPQLAGRVRYRGGLPDFRNLGVMLRILLLVNALALLAVLVRNADGARLWLEVLDMAMRVEFPLILSVAVLFLAQPLLARLPAPGGLIAVGGVVLVADVLAHILLAPIDGDGLGRSLMWSWMALGCVLAYFHHRGATYAPALAEARLLALTARIRPHFLFNSLNGVLGVLRSNPRRAEEALEELSDLFRALMQDNRELVPLAHEADLCERYLNLERLRLGERLAVDWLRDPAADAALVPPLMLQPLIENAVYHGIEPGVTAGTVSIATARRGAEVHIEISNPVCESAAHHAGNRMAVDNIRERLMLFYDLEASLDVEQGADVYRVRIRLPYRTAR
ncbi:sensor histidine kinase [Zoogloea sp. LCSB751]|uniref:sensor histidine kinase n=1 Tax=Zoogloea sp. LCSB751 TaxID=1965277 RepID=UPI0015701291|nr:histidine kinase [Zoogloea sp. LCSB751]